MTWKLVTTHALMKILLASFFVLEASHWCPRYLRAGGIVLCLSRLRSSTFHLILLLEMSIDESELRFELMRNITNKRAES